MRLREGPGENPASLVSRHASHHPRLGRGGWAAAVELWLRQLSGRAAQRNRPDPVLRGAQRGRRAVGAVERVARPRVQVAAHPELWPRGARATPICAVVCTDGEIDHTLGLLLLRESTTRLPVYAPASVAGLLEREWPVFRVLSAYAGIEPRSLPEGQPVRLADAMGATLGISCTAVAVARRPPRYARQAAAGTYDVGLRLMDEPRCGQIACVPAAGAG